MLTKKKLLIAFAVGLVPSAFMLPRISQDPMYHLFADGRFLLGIANFGDVASNLTFLLAAVLGWRRFPSLAPAARRAHAVFLIGLALTSVGSAFYHLNPSTPTLFWDRLPMTIAFMGFLSFIVAERVSPEWSARMLVPALLIGIGSVLYWIYTESSGMGDLRPYGLVQFGTIFIALMIVAWFKGAPPNTAIGWLAFSYVLAKFFELYDREIFVATGQAISGHTLKHLTAGLGACLYVRGMSRRN